jgi:hypothetical protein
LTATAPAQAALWLSGAGIADLQVTRDDLGNARGGIRLSQHAVPTAVNTGQNTGGPSTGSGPSRAESRDGMFCGLLGSHEPFDAARLAMLYPTHELYVAKARR